MELKEKRIIVSGCAKGMGEATLNSYVKAGADVVGMDIDIDLDLDIDIDIDIDIIVPVSRRKHLFINCTR